MGDKQVQDSKRLSVRRVLNSQVFWSLLVGLSWLLYLIIDFIGGYHGFHIALGLLPAAIFPMFFALIFTLVVLIRALWSIIRLRHIARSLLLIVVTLAFCFIPSLCPHTPYMVGFKYRTLKISSPQELRKIAAKARMLLAKQESLPGPGTWSLREEETYAVLWEKMPKSKILSSCYSMVVISVSDDNCVELSWGSSLVGHWGIRIADYPLEKDKYDFDFIHIEPNIAVYMTN